MSTKEQKIKGELKNARRLLYVYTYNMLIPDTITINHYLKQVNKLERKLNIHQTTSVPFGSEAANWLYLTDN